jgi:hypothetical protein
MGTARYQSACAGIQTSALAMGGATYPPPASPLVNNVEEWTGQAVQVRTITTS